MSGSSADMDTLDRIREFISGWRFPIILISMIGSTVLLMGAVLLIPSSAGPAYAFAEDFKVLCFGYDPASGSMEWAYVWMFLVQPLILAGLMALVWRDPLTRAVSESRAALLKTVAGTGCFVVVLAAMVPFILQPDPGFASESFPGERIRTSVPSAAFQLTNQHDQSFEMASTRGQIVVLTAVYATCGDTCPQILQQVKRAVGALSSEEQEQVTVVTLSLDPETDTPAMLTMIAEQHGLSSDVFQLLTGAPEKVDRILDDYGFRRWRNERGIIEHANLIHVIDREGLIAYRLALGDVQAVWLEEAMKQLIAEPAPVTE